MKMVLRSRRMTKNDLHTKNHLIVALYFSFCFYFIFLHLYSSCKCIKYLPLGVKQQNGNFLVKLHKKKMCYLTLNYI